MMTKLRCWSEAVIEGEATYPKHKIEEEYQILDHGANNTLWVIFIRHHRISLVLD